MRRIFKYILAMLAANLLLPGIIVNLFSRAEGPEFSTSPGYYETVGSTRTPGVSGASGVSGAPGVSGASPSKEPMKSGTKDEVKILMTSLGTTQTLPLEEYVKGVVASEMPVKFGLEALKAQAVAARTYAQYCRAQGLDLCDSALCCQAYRPFDQNIQGAEWVEEAVESTKGEILIYGGQPILAVFHSNSSGWTENVEDVWGGPSLPYLRSVRSFGEDENPEYRRITEMDADDFYRKLLPGGTIAAAVAYGKETTRILGWTDGGRVDTLVVNGVKLKGTQVREMLGLKSACFEVEWLDGNSRVRITTAGSGHGVGMSQWGARYLAENGKNYREILQYYYTGVTFSE